MTRPFTRLFFVTQLLLAVFAIAATVVPGIDPAASTAAEVPLAPTAQTESDDTDAQSPTAPVDDEAALTGELQIISQSNYVAADGTFEASLEWTGPVDPDLTVAVVILGRLDTEAQLTSTPSVLNRVEAVPLITLRSGDGLLNIEVPIRSFSPALPDEPDRIWIPEAGVYPIVIEIRDPGGAVASVRSHLIRLGTETLEIDLLPVSIVLPLSSADGLGMDAVTGLLEAHPLLPIAVLLDTSVINDLADRPQATARLVQALGDREVIVGPLLDLDPSALAQIGHGDLYRQALDQTTAALEASSLVVSDRVANIEPRLTTAGAELLLHVGIDVVLDLEATTGGIIATPGGVLRIVAIDDELTSLLTSRNRPAESAHLLLARLALRNERNTTPVLVGGPAMRGATVEAIETLLTALDDVGLLEPTSLVEFAENSPALTIRPIESPNQNLSTVSDTIQSILELNAAYDDFHRGGSLSPAEVEDALLSALSRDRNTTDRTRALDLVRRQLEDALNAITLRENQAVTLTARRLTIPLSIENRSDGDRTVRLRFVSDKVEVDENDQLFDLPPGSTTLELNVEARSLGVSPLGVEVWSPDGRIPLEQARLQIRSTAVPGLGLLISGAALTFLIGWWIVSIGKSRAAKHLGSTPGLGTLPTTDAARVVQGVNVGDHISSAPQRPHDP